MSIGYLIGYKSINNSINGNPNYDITVKHGNGDIIQTRSSSDSAFCYDLTNIKPGATIKYTTTKTGRIKTLSKLELADIFVDKMLFNKGV